MNGLLDYWDRMRVVCKRSTSFSKHFSKEIFRENVYEKSSWTPCRQRRLPKHKNQSWNCQIIKINDLGWIFFLPFTIKRMSDEMEFWFHVALVVVSRNYVNMWDPLPSSIDLNWILITLILQKNLPLTKEITRKSII